MTVDGVRQDGRVRCVALHGSGMADGHSRQRRPSWFAGDNLGFGDGGRIGGPL